MKLHSPLRSKRQRASALALATVAALAATAPLSAHAAPPTPDPVWADRAVTTYDATQDHLYLGAAGHQLYKLNTSGEGNPYSYLWEYREAAQATADLQGVRGFGTAYDNVTRQRVANFDLYYAVRDGDRAGYESYVPAPLGTGGDVYYDDNAIVGLTNVREYRKTDDASYLDKARGAFDIVIRGWNTDESLTCPGGMDWIDRADNADRGANITGLTAQLAAHLYEQTGEADYLEWSKKLYDWNTSCLGTSPGLYSNSINDAGEINPTLWTYNSGSMIATATILYRATGDVKWVKEAEAAAEGSLEYWTAENRLQQQPAIFNAFYFRDLLLLDSVRKNSAYRDAIEQYAHSTWDSNRDPETGLFHFQPSGGGDYNPTRPAATLDNAGMIQIFAMLAWDRRDLSDIS
ncbi:glycoside hydrolase family 76 protein [Microbacterium sp.]|uniref:glycoside hydrolase family 76 protein n=1 Tax=Microbacterium sp. TaxID=51671 RepID=UPI0027322EF5|nr:glycoside hydrolase family 76 protein [Microbacterium sp.]MDP3951741.1 glycoside hydrolase family 76 protein [Microbacterium sp.]